MKKFIIAILITVALIPCAIYYWATYITKEHIKDRICNFIDISPDQLSYLKYHDIFSGTNEGYTFGRLQSEVDISEEMIKELKSSNGDKILECAVTTSDLPSVVSYGLGSVSGYIGLQNSLDKLNKLISERQLLYCGLYPADENAEAATFFLIDIDLNQVYYIDYQF